MPRAVALLGLLLSLFPAGALAQGAATIVYDVKLREFTCWTEAPLMPPLVANPVVATGSSPQRTVCDAKSQWHPVTSDLYFLRGQAISILLVNAVALDLFSIEIAVEDLAEPAVPVAGSFGELPKLLPLVPSPTLVPGVGVALSAAVATVKPSAVYRRLTASEEKDFAAWVQSVLIAPLTGAPVNDFLALDSATALDRLDVNTMKAWLAEVETLTKAVSSISEPVDTDALLDRTRTLVGLLEVQHALRGRLAANGIPQAGKTVADGLKQLSTTALAPAIAIDSDDFGNVIADFESAFPDDVRYGRINAITIDAKGNLIVDPKYKDSGNPHVDMKEVLSRIQSAAGGSVPAAELTRLKKNLNALFDVWNDVRSARFQAELLNAARVNVEAHRKAPTSVFVLQTALNQLADATISKASRLNLAGATIPLDDRLRVVTVGQWFSSKAVTVTVKKGQRAAMFDVGGVIGAAGGSAIEPKPEDAKAPTVQPAIADLATTRTFRFPVYNAYHFQLGLGAAYSTADNVEFKVSTVTTGSGESAKTEKFIEQTVARDYNLLWTANLIIFPQARHAFPWRPRYVGEHGPKWWTNVGALVGFSIPDPTRNFLFGGAWFPDRNTVGLQVSWHLALRDVFVGDDPEAALSDRVTVLERKRFNGVSFGLIVTPDFFTKVLAPIFKP
jgi:hypothetical protein